jgi:opacity protein-like surface antigen
MRNVVAAALLLVALASPLHAQTGAQAPPPARVVSLSGPRFGITMLSPGVVSKLKENSIDVGTAISQFGWQSEKQFYGKQGGVAALNEWVFLLGGLDQSVAIPSVSWLVGLRTQEGAEFGIGPNVTPAGVALAVAAGMTIRTGILNIPMNFAVVPTKAGTRVTMLTGFTLRR